MSAIWGIIHLNGHTNDAELNKKAEAYMSGFKLDRIDKIETRDVYFACGHQYFTNEAENDISPIYNSENETYFTADCYLYNREELISTLYLPADIGDASLAYNAYCRWGVDFVKKLRGSFSIAIFSRKENKVWLFTDHTSRRYLAYHTNKDFICFSSTYAPIKYWIGNNLRINDRFIALAYMDSSAETLHEKSITAYEGVFHVDGATYVEIDLSKGTSRIINYWNPLNRIKKRSKISDSECKNLFRQTFNSSVCSLLRARNNTAIMLSGGYDSSTVAAFAASELKNRNQKLYSFTSVPATDFKYTNNIYATENETENVLKTQEMYPNIEATFVNGNEGNCFTHLSEYPYFFNEPVKAAVNMVYISDNYRHAFNSNCDIMLLGEHGNGTISYGDSTSAISQCFYNFHWFEAIHELKAFCKKWNMPIKKYVKKAIHETKSFYKTRKAPSHTCYLSQKTLDNFSVCDNRLKKANSLGSDFYSKTEFRNNFIYMPLLFQHIGYYETHISLLHHVLPLDPTFTVEIIEFCLSLPSRCYVHNGVERRLVREFLSDMLPKEIFDENKGKGSQSADFAFRAQRDWDQISDKIFDVLSEPLLERYLDMDKVNALASRIKAANGKIAKPDLGHAASIGSLVYFLRENKEYLS